MSTPCTATVSPDLFVVALFVLAAIPATLYTLIYLFRPWWTTPQGRALMVKSWGNTFLLNLGLATWLFGDFAGRAAIRDVGLVLFAVGLWYLLWTLLTSPGAENFPPRCWFRRRR